MAQNGGLSARLGSVSLAKVLLHTFIALPLLRAAPLRNDPLYAMEEPPVSPSTPTLWIYLVVAIALVLIGGAFAGLTIALMGQVRDWNISTMMGD